jgi:hypothetical protein
MKNWNTRDTAAIGKPSDGNDLPLKSAATLLTATQALKTYSENIRKISTSQIGKDTTYTITNEKTNAQLSMKVSLSNSKLKNQEFFIQYANLDGKNWELRNINPKELGKSFPKILNEDALLELNTELMKFSNDISKILDKKIAEKTINEFEIPNGFKPVGATTTGKDKNARTVQLRCVDGLGNQLVISMTGKDPAIYITTPDEEPQLLFSASIKGSGKDLALHVKNGASEYLSNITDSLKRKVLELLNDNPPEKLITVIDPQNISNLD